MDPDRTTARRGAWFTLLCVLLLGVFLLREGLTGTDGRPPQAARAPVTARDRTAAALPPAPGALRHSPPRRISVPSLAVDAPLTAVGLAADGSVQAPPLANRNLAGWYTGAAAPGERGTSVIVGHVDNTTGPSVFHLLGSLERESRIGVLREDGTTAVFAVYATEVHARTDFPADRVYRDGPEPELRLITCGGRFTARTGYDANVVVFARLVEVR
ncbi:class F sortase [Streptomyces sp. CAU 1734]|uniref:class F sortase n=1 Tax=Streptomyces sp. CAU 1734 TaxID=3140360 RepID=UPI003260631F